jgi:hypothetical protein
MSNDNSTDIPTDEGKRRYPETGGYFEWDNGPEHGGLDRFPCKCTAACLPTCDGRCGCRACSFRWAVFIDEAGLMDLDNQRLAITNRQGRHRYGPSWPEQPNAKPEPDGPTAEGLERYPECEGFWVDPDDGYREPCVCQPACPRPCDGQCGCAACGERHALDVFMAHPNSADSGT